MLEITRDGIPASSFMPHRVNQLETISPRGDGDGADLSDAISRWLSVVRSAMEQDPAPEPEQALDEGLALLEPITLSETRGVESLLGELYAAAGRAELTADQERRILDLADLIRWQRDQTAPEETPRWTLVGVARAVLFRLAVEVPIAVASDQIGITLQQMGWLNIAHGLGHGLVP